MLILRSPKSFRNVCGSLTENDKTKKLNFSKFSFLNVILSPVYSYMYPRTIPLGEDFMKSTMNLTSAV